MPPLENSTVPADWAGEARYLADRLNRLGKQFECSHRQLTSFRHVLEQMNRGVHLEEIADYLYSAFREVIPYDRLGLALIDEGGERVTSRWARSETGALRLCVGFSAPLAGSSLQHILRTGKPRILHDLEGYLQEHPESVATRRIVSEGILSSLTCPLTVEARPVGFLFFSSTRKGAYRDAHVEIFQQIASALSVSLERARLYERMAALNQDLEEHVKAQQETNERIEQLMLTDELTGIANRRAMHECLQAAMSFSVRHQQPLAILMIDLDHFKCVNDTHGHQAGDVVLREFAARVKSICRLEDTVARFGGEEFVVLLPCTDSAAASLLANRVRADIAARPFLDERTRVTASIGVAQLRPGETADELLRRVDARLYDAKAQGRNRVVAKAA